ncbi:MAG: alpha/beta fold hydrolase [Byssovorax sp.]
MATDASALPNYPVPLHDRYAELPGLRLHYVEAGSGPLVVLLHGFPEFWYAWRKQIAPLAQAGYRVVAPDMRGYNLSGKPQGISAYGTRLLVEDIANLIRACGEERAFIVGHDWGAGVAWAFAIGAVMSGAASPRWQCPLIWYGVPPSRFASVAPRQAMYARLNRTTSSPDRYGFFVFPSETRASTCSATLTGQPSSRSTSLLPDMASLAVTLTILA